MIVITHRPSCIGWEYESQGHPDLEGVAKSLSGSVENADHAVRNYLSCLNGYAVRPEDARHQVEHLVSETSDSDVAVALPRD